MSSFFGTDGIRMPAADFTPQFLHSIVKGLYEYGKQKIGQNFKVLVGGDTRESSESIIKNLCLSLQNFGIKCASVGVLPTPAINHTFYTMGFDFAIDVTASHNPYKDNGIKIFERGDKFGQKLSDVGKNIIESELALAETESVITKNASDHISDLHDEALGIYIKHLKESLGNVDFSKLSIGIDCANGAMGVIGADVFADFGAKALIINNDTAYGQKINNDCGSTHLESIKKTVIDKKLDFGIAFDGDGDRVLMIDEKGNIIDGDQIVVILTDFLKLKSAAITVMANQGIFEWASNSNIKLEITPVGDQNVFEAMSRLGISIGGEQSGHIILPGEPTGDGMLTALMVTKAIVTNDKNLKSLADTMQKFPQVIVNLNVTKEQKSNFSNFSKAQELLKKYSEQLDMTNGRLLVRPSGTENIIRVTMWGKDFDTIHQLANNLASELKEIL